MNDQLRDTIADVIDELGNHGPNLAELDSDALCDLSGAVLVAFVDALERAKQERDEAEQSARESSERAEQLAAEVDRLRALLAAQRPTVILVGVDTEGENGD